jgi:hypothetical protein
MKHVSSWSMPMKLIYAYWVETNITKKNTEGVSEASKDVVLEVNTEKTTVGLCLITSL